MKKLDLQKLKQWFMAERRNLPWREDPSAYAVWVSEVMLQQTRVSVVISYFERWMQLFPTIHALAEAPIADVIKAWEGLGYYSRARNLHAGARQIMDHFGGCLPSGEEELKKIKGLGAYTIGAIQAFAFQQRAAAVDGNVLRVMSRYAGIAEDISKSKTVGSIRKQVLDFLPSQEPWIIAEALIELGATLCSRTPKCLSCPLQGGCTAYAEGKVHLLPVKAKKTATIRLYRAVFVVIAEGFCLVKRGKKGKIMEDLYEFPYVESEGPISSFAAFIDKQEEAWGARLVFQKSFEEITHAFTKYQATLFPALFYAEQIFSAEEHTWLPFAELKKHPFSSGHRQICEFVCRP